MEWLQINMDTESIWWHRCCWNSFIWYLGTWYCSI